MTCNFSVGPTHKDTTLLHRTFRHWRTQPVKLGPTRGPMQGNRPKDQRLMWVMPHLMVKFFDLDENTTRCTNSAFVAQMKMKTNCIWYFTHTGPDQFWVHSLLLVFLAMSGRGKENPSLSLWRTLLQCLPSLCHSENSVNHEKPIKNLHGNAASSRVTAESEPVLLCVWRSARESIHS